MVAACEKPCGLYMLFGSACANEIGEECRLQYDPAHEASAAGVCIGTVKPGGRQMSLCASTGLLNVECFSFLKKIRFYVKSVRYSGKRTILLPEYIENCRFSKHVPCLFP